MPSAGKLLDERPWRLLIERHANANPLALLSAALMKALMETGAQVSVDPQGLRALYLPGRLNGWTLNTPRTKIAELARTTPTRPFPDGHEPLLFLEGGVPWAKAREDKDSFRRSPDNVYITQVDLPYSISVYLSCPGQLRLLWPGGEWLIRDAHAMPVGLNVHYPVALQRDPSLTWLQRQPPLDLACLAETHVQTLIRGLQNRSHGARARYVAECLGASAEQLVRQFPDYAQTLWNLPIFETHAGNSLSLADLGGVLREQRFLGIAWETAELDPSYRSDQVLRYRRSAPLLKTLKLEPWVIRLDRTRSGAGVTVKELLANPGILTRNLPG